MTYRGGYLELHTRKGVLRFPIAAESGDMLCMACGAKWEYSHNDATHSHYFIFERDTYVFDGKYLVKLGAKTP